MSGAALRKSREEPVGVSSGVLRPTLAAESLPATLANWWHDAARRMQANGDDRNAAEFEAHSSHFRNLAEQKGDVR